MYLNRHDTNPAKNTLAISEVLEPDESADDTNETSDEGVIVLNRAVAYPSETPGQVFGQLRYRTQHGSYATFTLTPTQSEQLVAWQNNAHSSECPLACDPKFSERLTAASSSLSPEQIRKAQLRYLGQGLSKAEPCYDKIDACYKIVRHSGDNYTLPSASLTGKPHEPQDVNAEFPDMPVGYSPGWFYRGTQRPIDKLISDKKSPRYHLQVVANRELFAELDKLAETIGFNYKFPNKDSGWNRQDTVVIYSHDDLTAEQEEQLAQAIEPFAVTETKSYTGLPLTNKTTGHTYVGIAKDTTPKYEDYLPVLIDAYAIDPHFAKILSCYARLNVEDDGTVSAVSGSPGQLAAMKLMIQQLAAA